MSYDLAVYGSEALSSADIATRITNTRGLSADMDANPAGSSWGFRVFRGPKRLYSFTVEGPYEDNGENTPETYAETVVFGIKYRYDLLIEGDGDSSGIPHAQAFAKKLAKAVSGFAIDLQTDQVWPKPRKPAPPEEWFRSTDWCAEARAEFEEMLESVPELSRSTYVRIKAVGLARTGQLEGARELYLRVLEYPDEGAVVSRCIALEGLGDAYFRDDPDKSEYYYRRLLAQENPQMTSGTQGIKLAEILIAKGGKANLEEAAVLLERWADGPDDPFAVNHFKWNVAVIHLAQAIGDRDAERRAARRALDLLRVGPAFPAQTRCPGVHASDETVERLERIAG